jgi:hypothetical protein
MMFAISFMNGSLMPSRQILMAPITILQGNYMRRGPLLASNAA